MDKTKPITVVSMAEKRRLEASGFTNVKIDFCTCKNAPKDCQIHSGNTKR